MRFHPCCILISALCVVAVAGGAETLSQYRERLALREGYALSWAESLRQRAAVEKTPELAVQRAEILAGIGSQMPLPGDVEFCSGLHRDDALDARSAEELTSLLEAMEPVSRPYLQQATASESPEATGVRPFVDEAWLAVGLRFFDLGRQKLFTDTCPAGLPRAAALKNRLIRGDKSALTAPVNDLMDAAWSPRVKADVYSLLAYASWAFNEQVPRPDPGEAAWLQDASVTSGQPTAAKLQMVKLFQADQPPAASESLKALKAVFAAHACPRWELDAALLLESAPLARANAYQELIQTLPAWYASRANRFSPQVWAAFRTPAGEHRWWPTIKPPERPEWMARREELEQRIDAALARGGPEDLLNAFKLLQQAKLLPLAGLGVAEADLPKPAAVTDLANKFVLTPRPFYQHAYIEYYWGRQLQGMFHVNVALDENKEIFRKHSDLQFTALGTMDGKALTEKAVAGLIRQLRDGKPIPTAPLCRALLPISVHVVGREKAGPLCDESNLRLTISPDGPLWGLPFEAIIPPSNAEGAMFSYTLTAAALAKNKVSPPVWQQCWAQNFARVLGEHELTLPPEQRWINYNVTNFALALAPLNWQAIQQQPQFRRGNLTYKDFRTARENLKLAEPARWSLVYVEISDQVRQ